MWHLSLWDCVWLCVDLHLSVDSCWKTYVWCIYTIPGVCFPFSPLSRSWPPLPPSSFSWTSISRSLCFCHVCKVLSLANLSSHNTKTLLSRRQRGKKQPIHWKSFPFTAELTTDRYLFVMLTTLCLVSHLLSAFAVPLQWKLKWWPGILTEMNNECDL